MLYVYLNSLSYELYKLLIYITLKHCFFLHALRLLKKSYAHSHQMGYTLASTLGKPTLFPSSFAEGIHYGDTITTGPSHRGYRHHQHDVNCPRFTGRRTNIREGSRSIGGMETSITSLHSSGQDSGIVDTGIHCQCGQSSTQSSGEDSTK